MAETGYHDFMRSHQPVVFGHEFCGEVARPRPRHPQDAARRARPSSPLPLVRRGKDVHPIGLSAAAPGAYAEQLIVEQSLALPVPERPAARRRRADRADGRRLARRPARRGQEGPGRDRHRLRADRSGRDPHAQGPRRAHRDRQRLLVRPPRARHQHAAPTSSSTRRRTRRTRGVGSRPSRDRARRVRSRRRHRREAAQAAGCPGGTSGAPPTRLGAATPKHPVDLRVRRRARRDRRASSRARRCSRASSWSVSAWAPTRSGPRWRSTRRSTCASSSATRR